MLCLYRKEDNEDEKEISFKRKMGCSYILPNPYYTNTNI